ncbi:MAG: CRISPR-associated helicase/endonuclease Cas3 [Methylovulum sp.]|nr:MAG: CRISPR-associated helicase/endonuclease Cas3 [Methylovulum sp.]
MVHDIQATYYRYWGKAQKDSQENDDTPKYHLLPYHCLDVAAVADVWWQNSHSLRQQFMGITGLDEGQTHAWLLFFIALHDYGKFDLRFQRKAKEAWETVNPELSTTPTQLNGLAIKNYYHGPAGLYWFYQDFQERFSSGDGYYVEDNEDWDGWCSWLAPVVGHHGVVPKDDEKDARNDYQLAAGSEQLLEAFKTARHQWLKALEELFLTPANLSLNDTPPLLKTTKNKQSPSTMLAGFCAVSDWLGSSERFVYDDQPCDDLKLWYKNRLETAVSTLQDAGVISQIQPYQNIEALLSGRKPRQVQCLIDQLPKIHGMTLIEASTGSGKTEAALAYAWQLLALGLADSIVFALPTQATANAMLSRLEQAAPLLFANQTNMVLAHGRANYQEHFINLKQACCPRTAQGDEEAWVQCGNWLAQSRKRVFLGQIGVCTVDQVLVSVLPVKHKFVRGFGIGRGVLIIDEVHAYDSYMYGLLEAVLEQQRLAGGSAILLSATLPYQQKVKLAKAWDCQLYAENKAYPLISHCCNGKTRPFDLTDRPEQHPKLTTVQLELIKTPQLIPNDSFIQRILDAVAQNAQVCLVCNLVAVAQELYQQIAEQMEKDGRFTEDQCLLFHSRFIFAHRQEKEQSVLDLFGVPPKPVDARRKGHVLIATQVVEQSLDLDFDWLITQLCPVDLLFQRMGRLHRHATNNALRPPQFARPICTVLLPTEDNYELHELIYGNSRVLWRTQQFLQQASESQVSFPAAYRDWIEPVYDEEAWADEPEWVQKSYQQFITDRYSSRYKALSNIKRNPNLDDNDSNVSALTRDGEMSLNLIPFYTDVQGKRRLMDDQQVDNLDDSKRLEAINLNSVAIPKNWGNHGKLPDAEEGFIWLGMENNGDGYLSVERGGCSYFYHSKTGFKKM